MISRRENVFPNYNFFIGILNINHIPIIQCTAITVKNIVGFYDFYITGAPGSREWHNFYVAWISTNSGRCRGTTGWVQKTAMPPWETLWYTIT